MIVEVLTHVDARVLILTSILTMILTIDGSIEVGIRKAVEQTAINAELRVVGNHVGHVVKGNSNTFQHMDVTILAGDVLLRDDLTVDESTLVGLNLSIGQERNVVAGDVVVQHELGHEVDHALHTVVLQHVHLLLVAHSRPVVNLLACLHVHTSSINHGILVTSDQRHRVHDVH